MNAMQGYRLPINLPLVDILIVVCYLFTDTNMKKKFIVVAGANGVGKTTFADVYHNKKGLIYLNADHISRQLPEASERQRDILAGELFLDKMGKLIQENRSLLIETTLAGRSLIRVFKAVKGRHFEIILIYIFLDTPELCIHRIKERVMKGGHHVADEDVYRRYYRSIQNFWTLYKNEADKWFIMINSKKQFSRIAMGIGEKYMVNNQPLFEKFMEYVKIK
jgi:predicted ABC-type ATPase